MNLEDKYRKEVIDKTQGEIRSFLDEVSNGTSRYRSLHSLTEQVEHQYHGRFLVELIQNAHDALFETGDEDRKHQRIEIVIAEDEHPYGALYIANDGKPFAQSNFKAISNLGQSDKDPQISIGNKGIGFRSVLEITNSPAIYSRKEINSLGFDGYCFRFCPDVIRMFKSPIQRIIEGENDVKSPISSNEPLLRWDQSRFKDFRNQCISFDEDWLERELAFLSPYALPIPIDSGNMTAIIEGFQKRGFSTVIRLPFLSENIRKITKEKMDWMDGSKIIFLQRLDKLKLVYGDVEKSYRKDQKLRTGDKADNYELCIESDIPTADENNSNSVSRYWLWTRRIGGEENPKEREEIKKAVKDLPGKWPEVEEATIAIAVQLGESPENGMLNIYLPTNVSSGCSAHFSAPFFGDMSRTNIDFENPFNQLLLKAIAETSTDVILESLARNGEEEAAVIIDLLSPSSKFEGSRWWNQLDEEFSDRQVVIENERIALSDKGWSSLSDCKFLPENEGTVVSAAMLRSEATYPTFVESLLNRKTNLERIFKKVGLNSQASPQDNAATIAKIAKKLNRRTEPVDWNNFWSDVEEIFDGDAEPLKGRQVILGTDNQLHACDENSSVFFRPRRSTGTDDEVLPEGDIDDIPEKLRPHIAFLNESIQTHVSGEKGGVKLTSIHNFLSKGLVETYGVERIFDSVLVKATPESSVKLYGKHSRLCRDILHWGLRLLRVSRGSMDEPIQLLGKLRAPCEGGWYPIEEISFGPGWPGKHGKELKKYLRKVGTRECDVAIDRLLLPPNHNLWDAIAEPPTDLLERAGVFDGIRLIPISQKDWHAKFTMGQWKGVNLPEQGPPGYSADLWNSYRQTIEKGIRLQDLYVSDFQYQVQNLYRLPGFENLERFGNKNRNLLMTLILTSLPSWDRKGINWSRVTLRKISGERHHLSPISPLALSLKEIEWMQGNVDGDNIRFRPKDRWYIPSSAALGGLHQFSHLKPMPHSVTSILNVNSELVSSMKDLGMPAYDAEEISDDPRLLNDLASALEDPSIEISNQSVFIGQIRTAWKNFQPNERNEFPKSLIVQNGKGPLRVVSPSDENAVYLPDASSAVHDGLQKHSKPVIAAFEAKYGADRLRENFKEAYGNGIRFASKLKVKELVDGEQWHGTEKSIDLSEEFQWMIPVVLSVFAYSTPQSRGTGTKSFVDAMDKLRETRISWVDSLEVGLWQDNMLVAKSPVSALWLPRFSSLLALNDARSKVSLLSEALASVVERSDIETSLKLVLRYYEGAVDISEEFICSTLKDLHISADKYQEVQQAWLGNLTWRIRLARPLILLLQPNANISVLDRVTSEEQFLQTLESFTFSMLNVDTVRSIVMNTNGFKSVGIQIWKHLGNQAQLSRWNEVLLQSGEAKIVNDQAEDDFQRHIGSIRILLRSIIRWTIRQHPELGGFKELDKTLSEINCPPEFRENYWIVEFQNVLKVVLGVVREWQLERSVIEELKNATSADILRDKLENLGLEPDLDPIQIHAENMEKFLSILSAVKKVAIAWCLKKNTDESIWGEHNKNIEAQFDDELSGSAYVDIWKDEMCIELLRKLERPSAHKELWDAIDTVSSVSELMKAVGITETDVNTAREQLEKREQERDRRMKTVNVCGKDFVNSEENLKDLWKHICSSIGAKNVSTEGLSDLADLNDQFSSKKRKPKGGIPTNQKKSKNRLSKSKEILIGIVGEIHAFRALQKLYGEETVTPSTWISENSLHKFPGNVVDDGYGCDIRLCFDDGKEQYIEVKATQVDDEGFELGSSEVELAIDVSSKRKKEFIILHVLNALSEKPNFRLLPNPYSKKFKSKYRFEEAGLRVRYKSAMI